MIKKWVLPYPSTCNRDGRCGDGAKRATTLPCTLPHSKHAKHPSPSLLSLPPPLCSLLVMDPCSERAHSLRARHGQSLNKGSLLMIIMALINTRMQYRVSNWLLWTNTGVGSNLFPLSTFHHHHTTVLILWNTDPSSFNWIPHPAEQIDPIIFWLLWSLVIPKGLQVRTLTKYLLVPFPLNSFHRKRLKLYL